MAALICIKRVCGTFFRLVNIVNRFLRIFSNLETSIRFIFPGGAGYPYLPTRLVVHTYVIYDEIKKYIYTISVYSIVRYVNTYDSDHTLGLLSYFCTQYPSYN